MLSNGFGKPLLLKRKPSRLLLAYLVTLHTLAGLSLLQPVAVPDAIYRVLWLLLCASAVYHAAYYWRQSYDQSSCWIWQASGEWIRSNDNERTFVLVTAKSVSSAWFVIVVLQDSMMQRQRVLIVRDQLDADIFRRLRVRLKLYYDDTAVSREDLV